MPEKTGNGKDDKMAANYGQQTHRQSKKLVDKNQTKIRQQKTANQRRNTKNINKTGRR
jgi:hypothetical protein